MEEIIFCPLTTLLYVAYNMWVYSQDLNSVSFTYVSVFISVAYYFDYYSTVLA